MQVPATKWARLSLFKMPSGTAWNSQGMELYMTSVFDWDSDLSTVEDWTSGYPVSYPRNTPVTMQIQTGFKYFFVKWQRNNEPITFDSYITPATESSGMNISYGGGQGFKILGDYSGSGGYKPISSSLPPLMTADTEGTARRGARLTIDNGVLSADAPTTTEIYDKLNTSHFVNNLGIGKIDISTNLAELKGPKGDTGKGWTGATYNGTTGKVSFASSDGTPFVFDTGDLRGGKGDKGDNGTNGKGWTGATYSGTTGKVSFTSSDGAPFVFDTGDLRGGVGANGKGWTGATYNATTGKVSFASSDGTPYVFDTGDLRGGVGANGEGWTGATYNTTTGKVSFTSTDTGFAFETGDLRGASGATITSTQLAALMNTTDHFTLNGTTSKIDFKTTYKIPTTGTADAVAYSGITGIPTSWTDAQIPALAISKITGLDTALAGKAPTSHTHTTAQITGLDTALAGKAPTSHTHTTAEITGLDTALAGKQATLSVGSGISIVGNTISSTSSSWLAGTPSTNIYYSAGNVGIGVSTTPVNLLELYKASYTGALLSLDVGTLNNGVDALPREIGKPLLRLGRTSYSQTSGDYYGIGFGYAPLALSNSFCEIGCIIQQVTGNETGYLVFSTRPTNTDVPATERMRISRDGYVGIGATDPLNKLHIIHNSSTSATSGGISNGRKYNRWSKPKLYYT
jgi:hypothetical protein